MLDHMDSVTAEARPARRTGSSPPPFDGYIRVSRVGGRDKTDGFISPDLQEKAIRQWSERTQVPVLIQEPELDRSGGSMDRPVFNRLLERIRNGESSGIVVYKLDRFARSLEGALAVLRELDAHRAGLASATEPISFVTPQERAFMQIQLVFAELEFATKREGFAAATKNAVERGIHLSHKAPFGYERGPDRRYVPSANAELVPEVFRLRAQRWGWRRLARWLDERAPRTDGKRWGASALQRMIASRVYLGEAFYGEHRNPDAHPPLVDLALFNAANAVRGASLNPGDGAKQILLRGLLRCAGCRYCLHQGISKGAKKVKYRTYRHVGSSVEGPCPSPAYVVAEAIEAFVVEAWKEAMRDLPIRAVPASGDLSESEAAYAAAKQELKAFGADVEGAARLRDVGAYESALRYRVDAVKSAEERLRSLTADLGQLVDGFDLSAWRWDVDEWWDGADFETRRQALVNSIDAIFVRRGKPEVDLGDRVRILWRGQGPDDLPRRGRENGPIRPYLWEEAEVETPEAGT